MINETTYITMVLVAMVMFWFVIIQAIKIKNIKNKIPKLVFENENLRGEIETPEGKNVKN